MRYKWATAHEWVKWYLALPLEVMNMIYKLDADAIQDEWQHEMEETGFFEDLNSRSSRQYFDKDENPLVGPLREVF